MLSYVCIAFVCEDQSMWVFTMQWLKYFILLDNLQSIFSILSLMICWTSWKQFFYSDNAVSSKFHILCVDKSLCFGLFEYFSDLVTYFIILFG